MVNIGDGPMDENFKIKRFEGRLAQAWSEVDEGKFVGGVTLKGHLANHNNADPFLMEF
ncbi:hypothetical protein [Thermococcus peptonophilus]|uniref:hypothetical protein n=1 Tax=Thermococcus peptonophilus TaxID=53952 RepID=UPI0034663E87